MSRTVNPSAAPLAVRWEGPFATTHSFALTNRALCLRLLQRGHRLALHPAGLGESDATGLPQHPLLAPHLRQPLPDDALHVCHTWPPRLRPPPRGHWIVMQPWEFGSLPRAWLFPLAELADAVWIYSSYLRDCYLRAGLPADRLHLVPLGVDPQRFHPDAPPRPLTRRRRCTFLFVGATIPRKGIDLLLDAYRRAFTAADDVCLVVKDLGGRSFYQGQTAQQAITAFATDPDAPAIEYLDGDWPDDELPGLYTACDCLVAPYRGEGFGLPLAEALACGRPVIATGHGAALDFCNADNAYLLPAREVRLPHKRIGEWETLDYPWLAEPDRDALIDLLRHVADHPDEARAKGAAGSALIHARFTWDHTAAVVEQLLVDLSRQPVRRLSRPATAGGGQPRCSLTMIVKNEAATLPACLASVQGLVDEIIVVDTGSSDQTREVAASAGARVVEFAWCDDFAAARNEGLRHAGGEWVLWLDADESFDAANRDQLRALLADLPQTPAAYVMKQRSPSENGAATVVDQVRLFRKHPAVRWEYRVHEQLLPSLRRAGHDVRFTGIVIEHSGYVVPAVRAAKLQRNLRLLRRDLDERPDDPFSLFNLGWAYADLGRLADAVPLLERSLQRSQPGDSIVRKLYALLTQCQQHLGRPREALTVCRAGRVWYPDDAELLFAEGMLLRSQGDVAGAEACWRQLLPADGDGPSRPPAGSFASMDEGLRGHLARHQLAVLCREQGRSADAEAHWRAALAQAPAFLPALLGLAELHLHAGHWDELERVANEVEPLSAVDAAVLRARGRLARQDFTAARRLLEETIARHPRALSPRIVLSHALLQEGQDEAAEAALRDVLDRDPGQAETWRNLAVLLRKQGRLPEAVAACQSGRLYAADDPHLLLLHGLLLAEVGDATRAETCLVRLLEMDRGDGSVGQTRRRTARHNLALLWRGQGRLTEAMAQWRALLAEEPGLAAARLALAEVCLAQGQWAEVESHLARLEVEAPTALETLLLRGRLHLARREFAAARQLLEQAGERHPQALAPRVLLSYALLQEDKDRSAAEQALQAVLALDAGNVEARHNLTILRRRRSSVTA